MNCLFGMLRVICPLTFVPSAKGSLISDSLVRGLCTNKRHALINYKADSECEVFFVEILAEKKQNAK